MVDSTMNRPELAERQSALAHFEKPALECTGAACLVVDWDGARVAVFGDLQAAAGLPGPGARAAPQWVSCALQTGDPARTGRLWAPCGDTLELWRLQEVGGWLAPVLALQSERDALAGKLRHVERAVRGADVGLWEWNVRSGHAHSGNNWPALLGYEPGDIEMSYTGWASLVHPADLPMVEAALQAFLEAPKPGRLRVEYRLHHRSGEWRWTLSLGDVVSRWPDGTPRVVAGTHQDIQAQKTSRLALSESEAYARSLFDSSPDCIEVVALDGTLQDVSPGGLRLLGVTDRDQRVGGNWVQLWPEPYDGQAARALASVAAGQAFRFRGAMTIGDEPRWWDVFAAPLADTDGTVRRALVTSRDISEQVRVEEKRTELEERVEQRTDALYATNLLLRNKEEQIRAIVENIPNCVITIDRDGIVTSANAAVMAVFGIPVSGAIGRHLDQLIPGLFARIAGADLRADGAPLPAGTTLLFKGALDGVAADGESRALEVSVGSYELHGEPQYAAVIRDVCEELASKHELLRARTEAEQASRAKSAFLATMSHEIRTPMNGVLGMSELLLQSPLPRSEREMVETIQQSASTLLDLLDDILDFSKIEAGKLGLEIQSVALEEVVGVVCATHLAVAEAKGVQLHAFLAPATPRTVQTDPVRLRQLLHNLIGNAIKFSAGQEVAGRVDVRIDATERRNRNLEVTLEIRDNGIGMTQEVLGRVFNPFTQGEGATTRRFGGTGLGLSICKRIVELMEGEIVCHSIPGQGTVFTIALGFSAGSWTPPVRPAADNGALRALVVSPDPMFRADVAACLQAMQVRHVVFPCGEDMAHWLDREFRPGQGVPGSEQALVISGPGIGDWRQLGRMAAAACDRDLPQLVWLPGQRQAEGQAEAGVALLGRAVVSIRILEQGIAAALGQRRDDRASALVPAQACFAGESIRLLIAEDHDINQRVIQRQLHRLGIRGDIAGDGEQALSAWRRGGYDAILADLHMPRMDGYTLARTIRQEEARRGLPRIPIIAFTANAIIGDDAKCFEAGMDDVVTKPVELERLREVLTRWLLSASSLEHDTPDGNDALPAQDARAGHIDVRVLQQLVGDAPEVVDEFLGEFRHGAARLMQALHAMVPTDGWRDARSIAHRLKSSARSVGAGRMGDLCEQIERLFDDAGSTRNQVALVLAELEEEWMLVAQEIAAHLGQP
jgi:PAS domain S-box-containing protein